MSKFVIIAEAKVMNKDELYISRTFDLARLGLGKVSPNPLVGCVVVHQDRIIGEGWHKKYGKAHAEVNALDAVVEKHLLPESTVYVNLEPCAHYGKTPPCSDMLVKAGVRRVVIANIDINPLVGGQGVRKLEQAGIKVTTGILEKQGLLLNKRFFTALREKRPYIILKWAETADGFIARKNYDSKWISNSTSRKLVHKWRSEEDAIMVGKNTALYDDPQLNVRAWTGRNPVRVIIDHNLELAQHLKIFDHSQLTLCYNLLRQKEADNLSYIKLDHKNFIPELLADLYDRNIRSIIIEGGAALLNQFITYEIWDEARVFIAPNNFEEGIAAPKISGLAEQAMVDSDKLFIYKPPFHRVH